MNNDKYLLAQSFWTTAFQYLRLVENAASETVSQGNAWAISYDPKKTPNYLEDYDKETRWSDHTIIIALLFNLLHGTELLVKGFILVDPTETIEKQHNICELCDRFKAKYPGETILNDFFDRYIKGNGMPEILCRFLSDNKLCVADLYQALRYPSPDFSDMRVYLSLKYQGEKGTPFFKNLAGDISGVRIASVRLARSLEN